MAFRVHNVRRILAVTTGGLGDAILFSPVLKGLRSQYPHAQIELLFASSLAEMAYASASEINRITVVNFNHSFLPINIVELTHFALRSRMNRAFDIGVFATGLNPKLSVLLKFAAGIPNIFCAPRPPTYVTDLTCNVALARRFDDNISESDAFVPLSEESRAEAKGVLEKQGVSWDENRIIAVCPSIDLFHRPRWELTKLKQVVSLLLENGFEGKVVIIGSLREGKEWGHVEPGGTGEINLAGKLSISASACVLGRACLALCNDGGLMHVAGAVKCPVVAIMPNAPANYHPPGEKTKIIHPNLSCAISCYPNRPKTCKIAKCVNEISSEQVAQACLESLTKFS